MKSLLLAVSIAACACSAALAQDQQQPASDPFTQACGVDMQSFCASAQSREDRHACIKANQDKFSDSCKTFMASHHMHRHGQGQMQGPPPSDGGGQ